jgi:4,5-dihydroxyphthalate decarboxylase
VTTQVDVFGSDYEHTLAMDGTWGGVTLRYHPMSVDDIFLKMLTDRAFPVCEFSLANYMMLADRGERWMRALPIFTNRNFRHSALYVRKDAPITAPSDLRGRTVALEDYSMTAAVWLRGLLRDDYGTDWRDITWCCDPARRRFPVPAGVRVIESSGDMEQMLLDGRVDALISFGPRDFKQPSSRRALRHLIPDVFAAEQDYYRRTGIYPISHCVVVRDDVLSATPGLPASLFEAFTASKKKAYARRLGATMVPWGKQHWASMFELFDGDPLPYGLTGDNRKVISRLAEYLTDQTLIANPVDIDGLFVPVEAG